MDSEFQPTRSLSQRLEKILEIRHQLRQPEDFVFTPRRVAPLPWRLSREAFDEVDRRVLRMVLPHNTEPFTKDGRSFLNFSKASNKTSKKLLILLVVLPTVLRGYIQPLRRGLRLLVLGLRMLEGQVTCTPSLTPSLTHSLTQITNSLTHSPRCILTTNACDWV